MIQLTSEKPTIAGFYFATFDNGQKPEILLEPIVIESGEVIATYSDETISAYDDAAYSVQLPEYLTPEFVKMVNDCITGWSHNVSIDFTLNEVDFLDESFSVFIKMDKEVIQIFTQKTDGSVSSSIFYGNASFKKMINLINE